MKGQSTARRYFAILIGIDDYQKKPLEGCVRDVQDIAAHLKSVLTDSIEMHTLTASPMSPTTSEPAQVGALRPTYENVVSAFDTVTSHAKNGDFVYVHYSGHGARRSDDRQFSSKTTGDLALVIHSGQGNDIRYFRGFELAAALKTMTDNGVTVTLILDCCFSASVYREGDKVRYLPFDPEIESKYPPKDTGTLVDGPDPSVCRDASMLPNWLLKPHQYAILTACGPNELATEAKFNGQRHGVLSYFLLEAMNEFGLAMVFKCVHDRLRAKFARACFRQSPVLYGNKHQATFGQAESGIASMAIPIVEKKDGTPQIQAGRAHGVNEGDQFRLYPLGSAGDNTRSGERFADAEVVCVRALTSDLRPLNKADIRIRTGWMASALSWRSPQKYPIRLASGLPNRREWLAALDQRSLVGHVDTDNCPFALLLTLSDDGEYRILGQHNESLENIPCMPQAENSIHDVADILWHLAQFRMVKDLANETPQDSFQDTYSVRFVYDGKSFSPGSLLEMRDNTSATLVMENHGNKALYFFIYGLGPCWQVENANRGAYTIITPRNDKEGLKNIAESSITMFVPDRLKERGYSSCKDIMKVFVTSQPTSFDFLELPKLGELSRPSETRISRQGTDAPENWAALNFLVHTCYQSHGS